MPDNKKKTGAKSKKKAANPKQPDQAAVAKMKPGALKRVLLRLGKEDEAVAFANHDSHVTFGSHGSHGSHGQHTSHSSSAA